MKVFIILARNENRAELDEDANSLGSGLVVSRAGCPRGSLQAQSFVNFRGHFLAFAVKRNLEKLTQLFQSPGDGGTRESCIGLKILAMLQLGRVAGKRHGSTLGSTFLC